jgi:hypothetical protein
MNNLNGLIKLVTLSVLLAVFSGCSSVPSQVKTNPAIKGAPDWVNKGSNVLLTKDERLFHGVSSASQMGDMALQKATADDRARAEVARVLASFMDALAKDYMATAKPGDSGVNEEIVSRQIKNTTRANMAGARIIGSWRDPKSSTIWSSAVLDLKHVKSTITGVTDMNIDLKRYIETSADNIFDRVARENKL